MFNIRTTMLFVVTLTLVTVLAIASYVRMSTTSTSGSLPAANAASKSVDSAPASAKPGSAYGTNMSTQSIRRILDWEYEHYRFGPAEKQLQHILDGRYERRVNLPY